MAREKLSSRLSRLEPSSADRVPKSAVRCELDELLSGFALPPSSDMEGVCSVAFFENGNGWVGVAEALRERCPPRRSRAYVEGLESRQQAERALLSTLKALVEEARAQGADTQRNLPACELGNLVTAQ